MGIHNPTAYNLSRVGSGGMHHYTIIFIFKNIYPVNEIELEIRTFFSFSYVSLKNLFNIVFVSDFSSIA